MTERKMYALTDDAVQRLKLYARTWGSVASHCAAADLVPADEGVVERTYTREDMARAWGEGAEAAWANTAEGWNGETAGEYTTHNGVAPFREANDDIPNPYEQDA